MRHGLQSPIAFDPVPPRADQPRPKAAARREITETVEFRVAVERPAPREARHPDRNGAESRDRVTREARLASSRPKRSEEPGPRDEMASLHGHSGRSAAESRNRVTSETPDRRTASGSPAAPRDDDAVSRDERDEIQAEASDEPRPVNADGATPQAIAEAAPAAPQAGDEPTTDATSPDTAAVPVQVLAGVQSAAAPAAQAEAAAEAVAIGPGAPQVVALGQGSAASALAAQNQPEGEEKPADKASAAEANAGSEPTGKPVPEAGKAEHSFAKLIEDAKATTDAATDAGPEVKTDSSPQGGITHGQPPSARAAAAAVPAHTPAPQGPVLHQVPLGAVPIEIGLKSLAGINRFEIRLDPAELGRIDVRLEIGEAGDVKAHLTVDRVETLALLQRDARTLERAFEQAGLKPSEGGVNLSLRDSSGDGRPQDQARDERGPPHNPNPRTAVSERPEAASAAPVRTWRGVTGVDLRI